jgi:transposase
VQVLDAKQADGHWIISARHEQSGSCPDCGSLSSSRHGWHERRLQDLPAWLKAADQSGLYAIQRFARTLRRDINAVQNAVTEPWSNGQTEGQINRLKTLKRAMYGRAGPELLRARMLPL